MVPIIEKLTEGAPHESLPYLQSHTPLGEWRANSAGLPMRRITDLPSWDWAVKQGWAGNPVRGFHPGYGSFDPRSPCGVYLVALGSQAGAARLVDMEDFTHYPIQIKLNDGRLQGVGDTNTPRWHRGEGKTRLVCDGTYSAGDNYLAAGHPDYALPIGYMHTSDLVTDAHASQPGRYRPFRDATSIKLYDLKTAAVINTGLPPGGHDISPDDKWLMHANGYWGIETGRNVPHAYARRNHAAWCNVGGYPMLFCMKNGNTDGDKTGFAADWHYAYHPHGANVKVFPMAAWGWDTNHHPITIFARVRWIGASTYAFTGLAPNALHNQNLLIEIVSGESRLIRLGAGCKYMAGGPSSKDASYYTENIGAISTDAQSYFYGDNAGGSSHMEIYEVDLRPVWAAIDATAPVPDEPPVVVPPDDDEYMPSDLRIEVLESSVDGLEDRVAAIEAWIAAAPKP